MEEVFTEERVLWGSGGQQGIERSRMGQKDTVMVFPRS